MESVAKKLFELLTNNGDFTAIMGTRLYPIIAPSTVTAPFSIYRLREVPVSIDGDNYDIWLLSYFELNKATEAMQFNDKIVEFFKDNGQFQFQFSEIDFVDETQQIVVMFNLKTI